MAARAPQQARSEDAARQTNSEAGRGAVREACEFLMRAQGTLDAALAPYLK